MSQQRNSLAGGEELKAANAIPEERILDAAYELLLAIGMRRMTMADIARQAGVSRATLYRRWKNVGEVVAALMTREWSRLGLGIADGADGTLSARERLVAGVVSAVRAIRVHPLLRKIVDLDPDFLLPYLLQRRGTSTEAQLALVESALRAEDGSVRAGDPAVQAQAVLLTAWSFALTGPVFVGADDGRGPELDALDEQLREVLERYLRP